jgi:tetratricopeptide (TPR) repeat protein
VSAGPPERQGPQFHDVREGRQPIRRRGAIIKKRRPIELSGDRGIILTALTWSVVGASLGALMGVFGRVLGADWGVGMVALIAFVGWACAFFGPLLITGTGGRVGRTIHNPTGRSTPHKREYSLAESFAVRGQYEDAITAFEMAIEEDASDPIPYLRIARIYRDDLREPERAAHWFKRALRESRLTDGLRSLTRKELVELYVSHMKVPGKAMPLLARVAEEEEGSADGMWAAGELERIRAEMTEEEGGS